MAGFTAVVVLSLATDELLHILKVYPPWGQPMFDPGPNLLALVYRCVYGALGSYLAARLAPARPLQHALALGWIGLGLGTLGLFATLPMKLGPLWYPAGVALAAVPCAWLGGRLASHRSRPAARRG